MSNLKLDSTIAELPRVGKIIAAKLNKLGIQTVRDLIFYFPFRYDDLSNILPIKQLTLGQTTTIKVKVDLLKSRRSFRQRKIIVEGLVSDQSGSLKVVWFNQPWITKNLKIGEVVYLAGKISGDLFDLSLINPVYELAQSKEQTHTARLVPVYSVTENLSARQLRSWLRLVWPVVKQVPDLLPANLRQELKLPPLVWALQQIHFPENLKHLTLARRRLKFDELFFWQLQGQYLKAQLQQQRSPVIPFNLAKTKSFIAKLPFILTQQQKKAAWQIIQDLAKPYPTNRLLIGEVGSGKTVVAALAILNCLLANQQAVIMAPTEILAQQHFNSLVNLFSFIRKVKKNRIALLTSQHHVLSDRPDQPLNKKEILSALASGRVGVIIGTQALLNSKVNFSHVALVVVDEQHRFGVEQRQLLRSKGQILPHFLALSATPIPRSLALSIYSGLEVSLITQLPQARRPVVTRLVSPAKRAAAYEFIRQQVKLGRQIFVICPIIDPSDKLGVKSVTVEYQRLQQEVFSDLRLGLLHGRLKSVEKNQVMKNFVQGQIDILISTSVVEVGIDVPNATVMVIEGAERFGLAQLHQLRGRVGRGPWQSYCLLFTEEENSVARQRLQAVVECQDGFTLAQKDLAQRGAGEIYGLEQSGLRQFKLASLSDGELIHLAQQAVVNIIKKDPQLEGYPQWRQLLKSKSELHLE